MAEDAGIRTADRRVSILGTQVTATTFEGALSWLAARVTARRPVYLCPANVYSVMLGRDDPAYRELVNGAGLVMADGMPLVWGLRRLGHRAERVHGDDLFFAACARFPRWRHFLLGGAAGQAEQVAAELSRRYPDLVLAGLRSTPRRPLPTAETAAVVEAIRASASDIVWVGMGTPHQDRFMAAQAEILGVPLVGVGSAFDLLAGRTRPAPGWVKRGGLQWLFRLVQEPRRLTGRYLRYNPRFLWHFTRQLAGERRGRRPPAPPDPR